MSKTVLAIESSSELCSVSLLIADKIISKQELAPREHAYLVLPFAQALLKSANIQFKDIDAIAFGKGPGAFTGLRVAASMAQGMALAHDLPLFSACSLSALALQAKRKILTDSLPDKFVVSVLDARMSELYWSVHELTNDSFKEVIPPTLSSAEDLAKQVAEYLLSYSKQNAESQTKPCTYFIGPGCRHLATLLDQDLCSNFASLELSAECFPRSEDIISLLDLEALDSSNVTLAMPVYLRNNVAAKPKPKPKPKLKLKLKPKL